MADERPPEGTDRPVDDAPAPDPVWRPPDEAGTDPTERVDLPWQQPPVPPAELPQLTAEPLQPPASAEPRSTIISAEPVLTERGEAARPEVAWAPPPAARA